MDYGRIIFENAGEASQSSSLNYAFVGIYKQDDRLVFRLPIGYTKPVHNNYAVTRDLHITFFKLFHRFRAIVKKNNDRIKNCASVHEDAGPVIKNGREWISCHDEGDVYYYRHFDAFDSLLEAFDELAILGLESRLRLTESMPADLNNFQKTDAGRIYQDDDSFYDDSSLQPSLTVALLSSDLVGLYCFLLRDLREHVWTNDDPNPLQNEITTLAQRFEDKHLWPKASCWEETEWELTRNELRDKLEIIDRKTAMKDEDYYRLYEAVERFLYPPSDNANDSGKLWGIDGFWPVWEWMVLTQLATDSKYLNRLLWIETGNLSPELVDKLKKDGFQHPYKNDRVLCRDGSSWDTFLQNGYKVGHPYPDAILNPAEIEDTINSWIVKGYDWIDSLILKEGLFSMSLTIPQKLVRIKGPQPNSVRIGAKSKKPAPPVDVDGKIDLHPVLNIIDKNCSNLDRPEVISLLHRFGKWDHEKGVFWRFQPFKSFKDVGRKNMGGVLLVDAKYKKPNDQSHQWANDHRKQATYEDVLTISCPNIPVAYSIYVCPSFQIPETPLASLIDKKEYFDREFKTQWSRLQDINTQHGSFKAAGQRIIVLGKDEIVPTGKTQYEKTYKALMLKVHNSDIREEIDEIYLSLSLLAVDRFPNNENFFFKNWPIKYLVDTSIVGFR